MINRQQRRYKVQKAQKAQLGPLGAREEEVSLRNALIAHKKPLIAHIIVDS